MHNEANEAAGVSMPTDEIRGASREQTPTTQQPQPTTAKTTLSSPTTTTTTPPPAPAPPAAKTVESPVEFGGAGGGHSVDSEQCSPGSLQHPSGHTFITS